MEYSKSIKEEEEEEENNLDVLFKNLIYAYQQKPEDLLYQKLHLSMGYDKKTTHYMINMSKSLVDTISFSVQSLLEDLCDPTEDYEPEEIIDLYNSIYRNTSAQNAEGRIEYRTSSFSYPHPDPNCFTKLMASRAFFYQERNELDLIIQPNQNELSNLRTLLEKESPGLWDIISDKYGLSSLNIEMDLLRKIHSSPRAIWPELLLEIKLPRNLVDEIIEVASYIDEFENALNSQLFYTSNFLDNKQRSIQQWYIMGLVEGLEYGCTPLYLVAFGTCVFGINPDILAELVNSCSKPSHPDFIEEENTTDTIEEIPHSPFADITIGLGAMLWIIEIMSWFQDENILQDIFNINLPLTIRIPIVFFLGLFLMIPGFKYKNSLIRKPISKDGLDRVASYDTCQCLYLRPHLADGEINDTFESLIETELVSSFEEALNVIALAGPNEEIQCIGAGRFSHGDAPWQTIIGIFMLTTEIVLIRYHNTPGLLWEVETALKNIYPEKIILFFPKNNHDNYVDNDLYKDFVDRFGGMLPISVPKRANKDSFLIFNNDWSAELIDDGETQGRELKTLVKKVFDKRANNGASTSRFQHMKSYVDSIADKLDDIYKNIDEDASKVKSVSGFFR